MNLRKLCSVVLSLSVLVSLGWKQIQPAFATELQTVPTESQQTTDPDQTVPEDQTPKPEEPSAPSIPVETRGDTAEETQMPAPELSTEPSVTIQETEPAVTETQQPEASSEPPSVTESEIETVPETTAPEETKPVSAGTGEEKADAAKKEFDAAEQETDLSTVSGQGITFRLFNYSTEINKTSGGSSWRPISSYFTFRNAALTPGSDSAAADVPRPNLNSAHDQDGFTKAHATVERVLVDGYPVLDLSRNADGSSRSDPGVAESIRSLQYLFSSGDHAVTAYTPANTILQQGGSHYWYNSADNAVDYDMEANRFRLRSYVERNSATATYGSAYGDFLPFSYTGGMVIDKTTGNVPYHIVNEDTDYWFGMTMQVNFFQTKEGRLADENMVFRFSGDDDVWVFVDDVLVLDLGGTHGTVTGSINFATGEVLQYLSWGGANGSAAAKNNGSSTSFPTTIRACFDAAERTPNGGWSKDGRTFADFTEHTLKFFYLERGAAVANCSLDFRLPTLPDESLTVTKDIVAEAESEVRDYIAGTLYYDFRVMTADEAGVATGEPFLASGTTYKLLEKGSIVGTGIIGEDNRFRLKAGQSAQFTQMLYKGNGKTKYVVEELMPDDLVGQYAGVEYLVSGAGGDTVTEDDPAKPFTAFRTDLLSAGETQTVTFRNRVDTSKLGTLKITKQAAPGTKIPEDLSFKIQVTVGESLLPVGTHYAVGQEQRTVDTPGILFLYAGETAEVETGILSGTSYRVTELSSALDGYRAAYEGIVIPAGDIECSSDGVSGEFPLAGTVHVTITNADYDFALQIPIWKSVVDYQNSAEFTFLTEQVALIDGVWQVVKTLPEQTITITDPGPVEGTITVGFQLDDAGTFYYRITEQHGADGYLYDTSAFLIEITVSDGEAHITGIRKDEDTVDRICFVNRAMTTLTVTKTVQGGGGSRKFQLSAEVLLNGEPFMLPQPVGNPGYTVKNNVLYFSLGHGESISLPCIPIGAVVRVTEQGCEDFLVSTMLEGVDTTELSGASREISFSNTECTLHYVNHSGYRLPNTGSVGTILYTIGGVAFSLSAAIAVLYYQLSRNRMS